MNPYDAIRYPGHPRPATHPDRLAALGYLLGMAPREVERCRVLELGCGDGANLIPMAYGLPDSQFVGVDLAETAIGEGRAVAAELGLRNVVLHAQDLARLPAELGEFDYIVAHGVYSWVPAPVRDALLAACARHLAPQGIAFVSYNVLPGGHVRRVARDMMRYHTHRASDAQTRISQSLALMKFMADAVPVEDEYGALLRKEFERVTRLDPAQLFHDDIAEVNEPVYFHQFVEHAGRHGLKFLAEAEYFTMSAEQFPPATREVLAQLADNLIVHEQYLDFLKCRRFRQTLLCRADVEISRVPSDARLKVLSFSSSATAVAGEPSLAPGVEETFRGNRGKTIRIDFPPGKAAISALHDAWPLRLSYAELQKEVAARLRRQGLDLAAFGQLSEFLRAAYSLDAVDVHAYRPRLAVTPGPTPRASALARRQATTGTLVTALTHRTVRLADETGRRLLLALDGTRDRDALLAELARENAPDAPPPTRETLDRCLDTLARLGLLEA
jgi:SAM-dependent methyltransferase